jgi:hypothetical protein
MVKVKVKPRRRGLCWQRLVVVLPLMLPIQQNQHQQQQEQGPQQ